jgi:hypothetical protein
VIVPNLVKPSAICDFLPLEPDFWAAEKGLLKNFRAKCRFSPTFAVDGGSLPTLEQSPKITLGRIVQYT